MSNPQTKDRQWEYRPINLRENHPYIHKRNTSKSGALFYVPYALNFLLRLSFFLSIFLFPIFLVWKQFFLPLLISSALIYVMRVAIDKESEKEVEKMAAIYSLDDIETMIGTKKLDSDVSRRAKIYLIQNGHSMHSRN